MSMFEIIFQSSMIQTALNIVQPPLMDRCQELHDINHDCDDNPHMLLGIWGERRENRVMAEIWVWGDDHRMEMELGVARRQEKLRPQTHQQPRTKSLPISADHLFVPLKGQGGKS